MSDSHSDSAIAVNGMGIVAIQASYKKNTMSRLGDIEKAIDALPDEEYGRFRQWFLEHDWLKWDKQIANDSASGKLEFLVREAGQAKANGTLKDL